MSLPQGRYCNPSPTPRTHTGRPAHPAAEPGWGWAGGGAGAGYTRALLRAWVAGDPDPGVLEERLGRDAQGGGVLRTRVFTSCRVTEGEEGWGSEGCTEGRDPTRSSLGVTMCEGT